MKHTILLTMAMAAIIIVALFIWNSSYEIARFLHVDYHAIDVCAVCIGMFSLAPSRALIQKKEQEI